MKYQPVFYVNGFLLLILSGAMLFPALIDYANGHPDWKAFAGAQIATAFTGFALLFSNRQKSFDMSLRETFLLTCSSWIFLSTFAALPFCFSQSSLSFTNAFFEAMSGLTTTGSTVISGLDHLPQGILFWRALLQWMGGIGFLIIALAILPLLQISGMQIYKSQSFGDVDKVLPSAGQIAFFICLIYAALSLICALLLYFAGMSGFNAIAHAMATVATGGFSTSDSSVGLFRNAMIEWITIIFMILGALPFVLYVKIIHGDLRSFVRDSQVRTFISILSIMSLMIAAYLIFNGQYDFFTSIRHGFFMITTLMTTTGFAAADYSLWGPFAIALAFVATFLGSCSGSTSGGIKIFRLQILWLMFQQQLRKLITPHGMFQIHYNGKVVEPSLQAAVAGFFFIYIATWLFLGVLLQLAGLEFVTAFTGALTAVSNVGPGLGSTIGPAGNFATLDPLPIWILSFGMMLGRLELLTLFVLLTPRFWKD